MADIFVRDANLVSLMEKTGYNITQENGCTKFGPPPGWSESPPHNGSEIFIENLTRDVTLEELVTLCEHFGKIYELRLMIDINGENTGYSFATFNKTDDATKAIKHLCDYEIRPGRHIKVCRLVDNRGLFVGGIPKDKSKEEIMAEISNYTEGVSKVMLYTNVVDKSKDRGFAFVEYETHRAAAMARSTLLASKIKLFDHNIFVDFTKPNAEVEEATMKRNLHLKSEVDSSIENTVGLFIPSSTTFVKNKPPSFSVSTGDSTSSVEHGHTEEDISEILIENPYRIKRRMDTSLNLEELRDMDLPEKKTSSGIQRSKVKVEGDHITKNFIKKHFSQFGEIQNIELNENCAILTYSKSCEASVMYALCLSNTMLDGTTVTVSLITEYETRKEKSNWNTVKIKYDGKVSYKNVKTYFEGIGRPTRMYINERDRYGFVTFKTREEMNNALKISGKIIKKTKLFVYALNKSEKKEKREEEERKKKEEEEKKKEQKEKQKKIEDETLKKVEKDETDEEGKKEYALNFYKDRNLF